MYVVIGGTGFLGSYITREIRRQTSEKIIIVARNQIVNEDKKDSGDGGGGGIRCDILNQSDLDHLIQSINFIEEPCKIIYLSAYLHPDLVEENPWISWNMNVISLEYLLSRLKQLNTFIFASTDSVYGNSHNSYHFKETDRLNPVNLYGIQKAAGEAIVNHYGYHSFRYPLLIGPSLVKGKNHFYDTIVENLRTGKKTEMFYDSLRSTLDFGTAAELTIQLVEQHRNCLPPILNVSGDEELSKYDIGIRIAEGLMLPKELIVPVSVLEDKKIYKAKRAPCTLLDNSMLKKIVSRKSIKAKL